MLLPSRDGFLTCLQETGYAIATVTATDDLAIVVPSIQALAAEAGTQVRIFVSSVDTLSVMTR